jgi:recombinational DNA repair protein (RecF pathway)
VYTLTHAGERHTELYELLVEGLRAADAKDEGLADLLIAYRLKAISALGFTPSFDTCVRCSRAVAPSGKAHVRYHVRKGGPLCEACEQELISLPGRMSGREDWSESVVGGLAILQFQRLLRGSLTRAGDDPAPEPVRNEMEALVRLYERYHLDQRTPLRTSELVRDVIQSR